MTRRTIGRAGACLGILLLAGTAPGQETWRGIRVAPEVRCSPYSSDDYGYPQAVEPAIIRRLGGIYSPYTCRRFRSRRETDIEHIVARSEAHDSGMCGRSLAERARFAQDLRNLTLASPEVNRNQKRAWDAARWLPERNRCWFAERVIDVRRQYRLTIDRAEAQALEAVLRSCPDTALRCDAR